MTRTDPRRGGFTLLELMVVILLIITLAALSAGAFYQIQARQRTGATETTLRKIQINMDARWRAVLDDARKTVPDQVLLMAGGDKERALSIWTYAKLKNEFPANFTEATTPIDFDYPIGAPVEFRLPARTVFSKVATTGSPEADTNMQSAALIYAALTATGAGGTSGDLDGLNQQVGTTPGGRQTFVDNWGTPIMFVRWASPDEIQNEPFSRAHVVKTRSGQFDTKNPFDPVGKLLSSPFPNPDNTWGVAGNPARAAALTALGLTDFSQRNVMPTLISAGPDKVFGADVYGANSADEGSDNVLSYRLRREGAQGN